MENIVKDQKQMILYLHKQAKDHVKTREILTQINEELEKEIGDKNKENTRIKKELELKSEKVEENTKLKKALEISDRDIEEFKSREIDSSRKIKEIQDDHRYSDLIQKVDKDNLEKRFVRKI